MFKETFLYRPHPAIIASMPKRFWCYFCDVLLILALGTLSCLPLTGTGFSTHLDTWKLFISISIIAIWFILLLVIVPFYLEGRTIFSYIFGIKQIPTDGKLTIKKLFKSIIPLTIPIWGMMVILIIFMFVKPNEKFTSKIDGSELKWVFKGVFKVIMTISLIIQAAHAFGMSSDGANWLNLKFGVVSVDLSRSEKYNQFVEADRYSKKRHLDWPTGKIHYEIKP